MKARQTGLIGGKVWLILIQYCKQIVPVQLSGDVAP